MDKNENQQKSKAIQDNESDNLISIKYKIKKIGKKKYLKLFGNDFICSNNLNFKIVFEGQEYYLSELMIYIRECDIDDEIIIQLKIIKKVYNLKKMFYKCYNLLSISNLSIIDTKNVTDMNSMFYKCSSLESISGFSNWNTCNVLDMSLMFYGCSSLKYICDISKWDTYNVVNLIF